MDVPLLDQIVLQHVFHARYMPFDLCVRLESVSRLFSQEACVFYRNLERLDVGHFLKRMPDVNWAGKIYFRCPKVKSVENVPLTCETTERDHMSLMFISKMKNVSRVTLDCEHLKELDLWILADIPHLGLVTKNSSGFDFENVHPIEKLRVTSFECDKPWLEECFCNPGHLQVLHGVIHDWCEQEDMIDMLGKFENLREITMKFCERNAKFLGIFIDLALNRLKVDTLSVECEYWNNKQLLLEVAKDAGIQKYMTYLFIGSYGDESIETYLPAISKLTGLRHLTFVWFSGSLDPAFWFNVLPDLNRLEMESSRFFESSRFDTKIKIRTTFKKR